MSLRTPWPPAEWFDRFMELLRTNGALLTLLMVLNVWGIVYGFYFYREQLPETNWYFLPFVPDSPSAVIFLSVALLAWKVWGKRWDQFDVLAAAANVKIGAWTVFVLVFHRRVFFPSFEASFPVQWLLLVGHTGMVLEALVLLPRLARSTAAWPVKRAAKLWLLPLGLFLLNDFLDYAYDQHPPIPRRGVETVELVSYGLTIATVLLGFGLAWLAQRWLGLRRSAA